MSDPTNTSLVSTIKTTHTAVEFGGVSFNTGATVPAIGNSTTWSRNSARAALAEGLITQSQYNAIWNALACYEQTQVDAARDTLRGTGLANS